MMTAVRARAQRAPRKRALPVRSPLRARRVAWLGLLLGPLGCAPSAFDRLNEAAHDARVEPSQPGPTATQPERQPDAASAPVDAHGVAQGWDAGAAQPGPADDARVADATAPDRAFDATTPSTDSDASRAPDVGVPEPSCDVASDPLNCGSCGHVCSALSSTTATCSQGRCGNLCSAGAADCDGDLAAAASNGCEVSLGDSALHCGACDVRCDAPSGGVTACEKRTCFGYVAHVGAPTAESNVVHGSGKGGGTFDLLCGVDEVLTGFDTAFDNNTIYGLSALCARITTTGTRVLPKLVLGTPHASPMAGALNLAWTPPRMSFPCPSGKAVTSLDGTLWYYNAEAQAAGDLSIKQLILTCAELSVDAANKFSALNPVQQSVGNNVGTVQAQFSDRCSAGSAVVGFKLRAGAWIDQVWTQCAALRVDRAATTSHVKAASEL